jgi:hypothetical protein
MELVVNGITDRNQIPITQSKLRIFFQRINVMNRVSFHPLAISFGYLTLIPISAQNRRRFSSPTFRMVKLSVDLFHLILFLQDTGLEPAPIRASFYTNPANPLRNKTAGSNLRRKQKSRGIFFLCF